MEAPRTKNGPSLGETRRQAGERMRDAASAAEPPAAGKPKKRFRLVGRLDWPMFTITLLLLLFGLVMLFSASYPTGYLRFKDSYSFILPQLRFAALGFVVMVGATVVDYHFLKRFAWPLMFVITAMLVVVLFMPAKNGAKRWIWLNSSHTSSIQPSEIVKFAVILLFAALIAANQHRMSSFKYGFLPFISILGVTAALLIAEPHLSCTILVLGIGISMMFAGGSPAQYFVVAGILGVVAVAAIIMNPDLVHYAGTRVQVWQDPFSDADGKGHQIIQSLIAVGSGGLTGSGLGNSVQKYLYLPEMYNDYIYAIVCEELGFLGAVAVMVLFLALLVRGVQIALRAKDKFGAMLVIGISVQIALQTFLHIAVNINAIPSTGISLPFFSAGGSSLVMLMAEIGVVLSVSRQGYATMAEARAHEEAEAEAARQRAEKAAAPQDRPAQ